MCVWSVITGSWPSMLTQTYPRDWPFEINKQTSDWLTQPTSSRVLHEAKKKRNPERSEPSKPNRNTCSSPLSRPVMSTNCNACKQFIVG